MYWGHHELWAHEVIGPEKIFENSYGYEGQHHFATLPGVRIFFSGGHYAVACFFVISGYVLSNKPLQYIHTENYSKLSENLSSALFRRWIRLFCPVAVVTFCYMTSWHLFGVGAGVEWKTTYAAELWNWYKEFKNYSFVFHGADRPGLTYSFHVWSIPTEFRGSIVIYTSLLAFSRMTRKARLTCFVGLIVYFLAIVDGWYCAMFVMGMLQCDLSGLAAQGNLPNCIRRLQAYKKPLSWMSLALGIYLGGCPAASNDHTLLQKNPGWHYLSYLKPEALYDYKFFFLFCAASLTIVSIPHISCFKRFFELRFNQYLGQISFAFYLVHGPILWTIADRLYAATGCVRHSHSTDATRWINMLPIPPVGPLGLELNFLLPHLLILPITLWTAEIVTRVVDEPSVRLSHWLYRKSMGLSEVQDAVSA